MKTADLYVRVSTDKQVDKGYSICSQEEILRKYCGIQNIKVCCWPFCVPPLRTVNRSPAERRGYK